jgi:hypothetical protein
MKKLLFFFLEKTRNGKTKYKDLVNYTLGEYFVTFTSNLLTMTRPAFNRPHPELLTFKNKRFGLGSVPDANFLQVIVLNPIE